MIEVSIRELKSNLSKYLRRAERGERIVVTRRGKHVAVLAQEEPSGTRRLDETLADLEGRGLISSAKPGRFPLPPETITLRGQGPSASEMLIRDRR